MENETPIVACEAIKSGYKQTSKGTEVRFILGNIDDDLTGIAMLPLGEVIKLYVTKVDIGC